MKKLFSGKKLNPHYHVKTVWKPSKDAATARTVSYWVRKSGICIISSLILNYVSQCFDCHLMHSTGDWSWQIAITRFQTNSNQRLLLAIMKNASKTCPLSIHTWKPCKKLNHRDVEYFLVICKLFWKGPPKRAPNSDLAGTLAQSEWFGLSLRATN